MPVKLYRAVSLAELESIESTGRLSSLYGHVEGKYFATTLAHAKEWGRRFYGGKCYYVEISVSEHQLTKFFYFDFDLDTIGPAYHATDAQLRGIHAKRIKE